MRRLLAEHHKLMAATLVVAALERAVSKLKAADNCCRHVEAQLREFRREFIPARWSTLVTAS